MNRIQDLLPAFKAFLLASRRKRIIKLADFIGNDLGWLTLMCCTSGLALHASEEYLDVLKNAKGAGRISRVKTLYQFGHQLSIMKNCLSDINKVWLSRRIDAHMIVQRPGWGDIWYTSCDALDHLSKKDPYISEEDPSWFDVKCQLAGWGNGQFHTRLTLDIVMEDKEAYDHTHGTLAGGFAWTIIYAGMYNSRLEDQQLM